jgi:asparagine synthase (glutamine-hydrolysing)
MIAALGHRGPDNHGSAIGSVAALGFTRLSIIDLSDQANQPMMDPTGRWRLVYNGEVYNYIELREELAASGWRFRTQSDTEVVLAALVSWGPMAVRRFNGMWALALVDELEQTVLLSRDRFGVKPLFFHRTEDGRILFGSEVKALLATKPSLAVVDDVQTARFLFLGSLGEGEGTFYRDVHRLMPGHNLLATHATVNISQYWSYPDPGGSPCSFDGACEAFEALLEDSVRLRLRSDVPVATTLSSGLDSSAIAALVRRLGITDHTTYTASFPGAWFDEGVPADAFSHSLGFRSRLISKHIDRLDLDVLARIVWHMDGPTLNPSTVPLWEIMRTVHADGMKVVLDGQGADELLGGYTDQVAPFGVLDALTERGVGAAAHDLYDFVRVCGFRDAVSWVAYTQVPGAHALYQRIVGMRQLTGPRLLSIDPGTLEIPLPQGDTRVNRRLRWQHVVLLRPLLEYSDRVSMAHSVETRLPFMDYRLVEFVSRLPSRWKVRGGVGKVLERNALQQLLTPSVLNGRKLGFVAPVRAWFSGLSGRTLLERLTDGYAAREGFIDRRAMRRLVGSSPSDRRANSLFRLLGLELWLEQLQTPRGVRS